MIYFVNRVQYLNERPTYIGTHQRSRKTKEIQFLSKKKEKGRMRLVRLNVYSVWRS